jgi:hypothetical protein
MQDRSAAQQQAPVAPSRNPAPREYVPSAPENWFVDPVSLGVPGVRQPDAADRPRGLLPGKGRLDQGREKDLRLL